MRTWKASKPARDTHSLERAEVGIGEDTERLQANKGTYILERAEVGTVLNTTTKQASEGHSHSRDCRI